MGLAEALNCAPVCLCFFNRNTWHFKRRANPCNAKGGERQALTAFESAYKVNLLHFNFSAGFNQLLLGFLGFFLGHGFLQGGGSAVNLVLGFLQAEAG